MGKMRACMILNSSVAFWNWYPRSHALSSDVNT